MFENVDCVSMYVEDLEEGLRFYRDNLGLKLLWRTGDACGLAMKKGIAEIVLTTRRNDMVDLKVADVKAFLPHFVQAGGRVVYGPFPIDIGQCAVVCDPWGNRYCVLDMTSGTYDTDAQGNVTGVTHKEEQA